MSAEVQLSYKCRILVQFEILSDKLDEEDILEYVVSEEKNLKYNIITKIYLVSLIIFT